MQRQPFRPVPCQEALDGETLAAKVTAHEYDQAMTDQTIRLTAAITRDGNWYVARCLEVEVASQGHTIEEALANLSEALELYFEDEPVPEAADPIVAPVEVKLSA
jgi:predicted RNase H-like HicB family nuclease